ncbi:MAG: protease [Methanobacteriota archaeon]|nr:MAG: protease [Euryarchaeota archaeon]
MHPRLRIFAMFAVLTLIFTAIGWLLGGYFLGDWILGSLLFLILAGAMNFVSYFWAHKIVLWSYHARIVTEAEQPRLYRIVQQAAQFTGLPMPKVAIVPLQTPNAFATGRNPKTAVVAATEGILTLLNDRELTGVLAHEMAHVKDRDILVMSVTATVAGAIAFMARMFTWNMMFGGQRRNSNGSDLLIAIAVAVTAPIAALLVQLAISRSRESKADLVGAQNFGDPNALADALEKLEYANKRRPFQQGNPASASLFIVNPFRGSTFFALFATHPPIEQRIKKLRAMAQDLRYGKPMPAIHPS